MSNPLNDFSQQDADLAAPGDAEQTPPATPDDDRETGLVGESDATGDQPALDDEESDDTDVSLRDVAEREQSARWS